MTSDITIFRIILPVANIDRAAEFYATLLDNHTGRRVSEYRHYLDCGSLVLALVSPGVAPPIPAPTPDGTAARANQEHVYFSVAALEPVHARARVLGCLSTTPVHGEPGGVIAVRPWRERSFYVEDPFGNPLCFVERGTEFLGRR
jgi:catechol 2,3-dioxygenase-like lactoylglutathione lyase family enzyme